MLPDVSRFRAVAFLALVVVSGAAQETRRTYSISVGGRVVGYQTETERVVQQDGRPAITFEVKSLARVEVLGSKIDQITRQEWVLDPGTRAAQSVDGTLDAGSLKIAMRGRLEDRGFVVADPAKSGSEQVLDPKKVVISPEFRWLAERGPKAAGESIDVEVLMPEMGGVQRAKVERLPDPARPVAVLGTPRQARSYRVTLQALATTLDVLIDVETHEALRYEVPAQDLVVEPAPERMVDRLERADLTSAIVTKTNLDLEDPSVLTSMKVRATIECTPDVTLEGLSVPGQRFDGMVEKGVVEGVFEIRPRRSDGSGATPWPIPPGAFSAEGLRPYLAAEEGIESDDPAIGAKARELASGASTCFEVVDRLGAWIGEHVRYEIPGGFTARRVFETGKGECGGHSHLMAAMLRSLGIPARTPMGGMYIPLYGGSFGQHMWNEVYLGAAIGWLPIDVTAGQRTFVDAGHIRLMAGVTRFRPRSIEVLAYEPREAAASRPVDRATGPYPFTVGETLVYAVSVKGQSIGEDRVTYRGRQGAGHLFEGTTSLGAGHLVETTWTTVGDDGRLISFRCERKAGQDASAIEVARDGANAVITTTTSEGRNSASVGANLDVFPLHNNCTAHFAIPLSRIALKEGEEARIRFLHDEQKAVFWMTLRGRATEELKIGDKTVVARVVAGSLLSLEMTFHLDERGRLLRFAQKIGDVVIELKAP